MINERKIAPYLLIKENRVIGANDLFFNMTGYYEEDISGRDISEVTNKLLRLNTSIEDIKSNDKNDSCFIFTKSLDCKEVNVSISKGISLEEEYLVFTPKADFQITDKFMFLNRLMLDSHNGIALFAVPSLTLLKANQRYLQFFSETYGSKPDIVGQSLKKVIKGWENSKAEKVWGHMISTNQSQYLRDMKGNAPGWDKRYWDNTLIPIEEDGKVKYVVCMLEDVTERVESRHQVEEQKKRLEAILDSMTDAVSIVDKDGNYLIRNKVSKEFYGTQRSNWSDTYEATRLYGLDGTPLSYRDMPILDAMKGITTTNRIMQMKFQGKERYISVSTAPIYDEDENLSMGIISSRDVTESIRNSQLIKRQSDELEAILENLTDILMVTDKDGKFIKASRSASIFGPLRERVDDYQAYDKGNYLNEKGEEMTSEETPAYRVSKGETVVGFKFSYIKGEDIYHFIANGTPIFNDNGELTMGIITMCNISDHIKHEKELRQQQEQLLLLEKEKNAILENSIQMKDEFLSLVSHEFKTPLNVILSALQVMETVCKNEFTDRTRRYVNMIRQNSYRQLRLVNNLLDITKRNEGHIKLTRDNIDIVLVTRSITESVMLYAKQKDIKLSFSSTIKKKIIGMDEEKYERILLNLLSNAIKFTPEGKSIDVKLSQRNGSIFIKVIDEGIGIPRDKQSIIFERFGQVDSSLSRQAEGTGIGLSLVKLFVEALEGDVTVMSKPEKGSTFTLSFPAREYKDLDKSDNEKELLGGRLVQSMAIELSDIYI